MHPLRLATAALAWAALAPAAAGQALDLETSRHVPRTDLEIALTQRFSDFSVAVVGGELITRNDILSLLSDDRSLENDPTEGRDDLTPEERLELRSGAALEQVIDRQLKTRGGRNQGYSPEQLAAQKAAYFEGKVAELGGEVKAAAKFAGWGFTPESYQDYMGELLLANLWEGSTTGRLPGPAGRRIVDNFVRPGQMYARYGALATSRNPEHRELVGSSPARVTLSKLVLPVPSVAETRETRANAETFRENVIKGVVEFDQLINRFAAPRYRGDKSRETLDTAGLAPALARLHPGSPADVEAFTANLQVGDLSAVMPIQNGANVDGYVIYRVEEVVAERAAEPFVDLSLQERLLESMREEASEERIRRGLAFLARTTHVEPEEFKSMLVQRGARRLDQGR